MSWTAVIIDDEPYIREVVRALGHWDALDMEIVGEAADGAAGLELIRQLGPDIVISDVKMPRMDGLQLAGALQGEKDPPQVIIVSGYDDFELVRQALRCGVSDYLLKPIKEDELNAQLSECVEAARRRSRRRDIRNRWNPGPEGGQWLEGFQQRLKEFGDLLRGGDGQLIARKFEDLAADMRDKVGLPEAVYCYYSFLAELQGFAAENGCTVEELCGGGEFGHVFGSGDDIQEVLSHVCTLYSRAVEETARRAKQRGRLDMRLVRRFVDENYDKSISLQSVAEHFFVSREYLSRRFKSEFGVSFSDYLLSCRMERAKQLLTEYHVPIKDIWPMLCFVDQRHFYKCFKRYFGITPGEMRSGSSFDNRSGQL